MHARSFWRWIDRVRRLAVDRLAAEYVVHALGREMSHTHRLRRCLGHPQVFELETTNHCPYTCNMCPRTYGMTRSLGHMDLSLMRDILAQVRPACQKERLDRPPLMRLTHYGEPVAYRHFAESIELCHARGLSVYLSSNPSAWTPRRIDEMLDGGLDELLAMVDGMDDETSTAIRGRAASYSRGQANLLRLAEAKAARGANRPKLIVGMVKQVRNAHQWEVFQRYWSRVEGVDAVYLGHFSTFDGDVPAINALAEDLAARDPDQARQMERQRRLRDYPCFYPWHSVSVTWEGRVVPCCRDYNDSLVLGDLRRQTLAEVWNGPRMQRLRAEFAAGRLRAALCRTCREPSLEIGLPGGVYPVARWIRRLGGGRMPAGGSDRPHADALPAPASADRAWVGDLGTTFAAPELTGPQNRNRDRYVRASSGAAGS